MLKKSHYYAQKFSPGSPIFYRHFGNWNINESQPPSRPTWPRPLPVVKSGAVDCHVYFSTGNQESQFRDQLYLIPMYVFIYLFIYFRYFDIFS